MDKKAKELESKEMEVMETKRQDEQFFLMKLD